MTRSGLTRRQALAALAITATPFSVWHGARRVAAEPVPIRRDLARMDPDDPDLVSLTRALSVMMALPPAHPLSWVFHANIHLTRDDPAALYARTPALQALAAQIWNQCPHGSYHFLPWHRLYLWFLERRVRRLSGRANFALPYWNYVTTDPDDLETRRLPAVTRQRVLNFRRNPLFVPDTIADGAVNGREPRYNQGAALGLADVSIARAFAFTNFAVEQGQESFGGHPPPQNFLFGALEETPHNNIHAAIGGARGLLSDLALAARDPVFFLHHANIDRLWASWLGQGGGRADPLDDPRWADKTWLFLDETGALVSVAAREAVAIAASLGYRYDRLQPAPAPDRLAMATDLRWAADQAGPGAEGPVLAAGPVTLAGLATDIVLTPSGAAGAAAGAPPVVMPSAPPGAGARLDLGGITAPVPPGGTWSLLLNPPEGLGLGAPVDPAQPYFAGTLSLWGRMGPSGHHHGDWDGIVSLDVTGPVAALKAHGLWSREALRLRLVENRPLGADGAPLPAPAGPIDGRGVIIGWSRLTGA